MAWTDRLAEAAYTAPDGQRFVFDYENVSTDFEKRTTAFEFPDAEGTYIQDLGASGRKYPLRVIFWGPDYDLTAQAFSEALRQRGAGVLEHPLYGRANVVPFGAIRRRDDLKTAGNQAIFEITFWNTIGTVYPSGQSDPASDAAVAVVETGVDSSADFAEALEGDLTTEEVQVRGILQTLRGVVTDNLENLAAATDEIKTRFDAINESLNKDIDTFIGDPIAIAGQIVTLVQLPARAASSIEARLSGYRQSLEQLLGLTPDNSNAFHSVELYAVNLCAGLVSSSLNAEFTTKSEAIEAADAIFNAFSQLTVWRDENYAKFDELDTGGTYQKLNDAVALGAGFLIEISFTLRQERSFILTRDRSIIDLVAQLYGRVDEELDFFINSNNLSGDEIINLP